MTNTDIAERGHNSPPDYAKQVTDRMAQEYAELANTVTNRLADARETVPESVETDADLKIVTDAVVNMRDLTKRVLTIHQAEKEPYLRSGQGVDNFFFAMRDRLDKASQIIGERGNVYNRRKVAEERARREREAAEAARIAREAQEAKDKAAREAVELAEAAARARKPENIERLETAAVDKTLEAQNLQIDTMMAADAASLAHNATLVKSADIARQRFDTGHMSTMKQVGYVEITDTTKLDLETLRPFFTEKELLRVLKAWAKTTGHKRQMAGATIEMRDDTEYRG